MGLCLIRRRKMTARAKIERAIEYMGLEAGQKLTDIKVDTVFIGLYKQPNRRLASGGGIS